MSDAGSPKLRTSGPGYVECRLRPIGFSSATRTPARIRIAPNMPLGGNLSPITTKEKAQATTGSNAKINAARVAVVICCAQACTVKAKAVESREETSRAIHKNGPGWKNGFSIHQKLPKARVAVAPSCQTARGSKAS